MKKVTQTILAMGIALSAVSPMSASAANSSSLAVHIENFAPTIKTQPFSLSKISPDPNISIVNATDFKEPIFDSEGLTEAELIAQESITIPVRNAVIDVEEAYKEQISYTIVGMNPAIGFKGAVPDGAVAMLKGLPTSITLVENTGYTESGILAQQDVLVEALNDRFSVPFNVSRSYQGDILVGVIDASGTLETQGDGNHRESPAPPAPNPEDVKQFADTVLHLEGGGEVVVMRDSSPLTTQSIWTPTGGTLIKGSTTGHICTSGFVAKRTTDSDLGILTAGHCAVNNPTFLHNGGSPTLSRRLFQVGTAGDASFYRSSAMMAGIIKSDTYKFQSIHGWFIPKVGDSTCTYGTVSNRSHCGTTVAVNQCRGTGSSQLCNLTVANGGTTVSGDSGGPVNWGDRAAGIHSGLVTMPPPYSASARFRAFTPMNRVMSITGTHICYDEMPDPNCNFKAATLRYQGR